MIEKNIAKVPKRVWLDEGAKGSQWVIEFNVASWIRLTSQFPGVVRFVLRYEDAAGEHMSVVDAAEIGQGEANMLFSGLVQIRIKGSLHRMNACLQFTMTGVEHQVDELYVQRRGSPLKQQDKLISSF